MDRGVWQATVHGVAKSQTQPSNKEAVKVAQSCPILWDPVDCVVHGILRA